MELDWLVRNYWGGSKADDKKDAGATWLEGYREGVLRGVSIKCDTTKETITTIADDKVVKSDDDVVNKVVNEVADILVQMNKAFNSVDYCEGINHFNVRGIYKHWAKRILEVV